MTQCQLCRDASGYSSAQVIYSDEQWLLRHSLETDILGYLILQSQRHFLDLSEANRAELTTYGGILGAAMKSIRHVSECERVYTFSLAEAVPHFHLHIIPRSPDFPGLYKGRGIMSYPLEPAADVNRVEDVCSRLKAAWLEFFTQ